MAEEERAGDLPVEFPELTDEELAKKVVVLVEGMNLYAQPVFSYVELTMLRFRELSTAMYHGRNLRAADYGTVLASGPGGPSDALRREMAQRYNLADIPPPAAPRRQTPEPRVPALPFSVAEAGTEPDPLADLVPDLSQPPSFSAFHLLPAAGAEEEGPPSTPHRQGFTR